MAIVLLSAPLSRAAEIAGHWVTKNQTDNNVYFFFGPEDDLLTLSGTVHDGTDRSSTLDIEVTAGRDVFTGINTDQPDENDENNDDVQDDDWVVYASCFVEVLAGILISP